MEHTFYLQILSPERAFYEGECVSLKFPVGDGLYGVQAHHLPLTAAITPGEVTFTKPGGEKVRCAVAQGMIDIADNRVKMLVESALRPDEIDEENERREAELAAADMKGKQSYKEYMMSQIMFARAVNNLRVKKHDAALINHE